MDLVKELTQEIEKHNQDILSAKRQALIVLAVSLTLMLAMVAGMLATN